jgi:uncharacterized protein YndB with AHSA1/START domain
MSNAQTNPRDLVLDLKLMADRAKIWRCWTEPELLQRWFVPEPWSIARVEIDVRPGGANLVVMRSPEGEEFPNRGVYLEITPQQRLVTTDAYVRAWEPSERPFMTSIIDLTDLPGGGTHYVARARHWTADARAEHESMGFYEGWGQCARQLEALAASL